ncbi:MAG: class I SAM-dependent methyltransferase [Saprospiraceae bacterium]|nr:class I SAM-dependent methyltransferase [Saprospiraceae bacterium]
MKLTDIKATTILFVAVLGILSCKQNRERPGGYQPTDVPTTNSNKPQNEVDDLREDWESRDRLVWQKPDMVIRRLGDLSQKTVADLGAGTGFFAFRLVPLAKKTIALDIDPRFITFMDSAKKEMNSELRNRFEARLVDVDNAKLKKGEADAVIIVNTYMYISDRVTYMQHLRQGISKGGMVLIVDYKEKNIPVGPPTNAKVPLSVVEKELKQAGFKNIKSDDTSLDYQYIITATND